MAEDKLASMLDEVAEREGTTKQGALRDLLTDLRHLASELNLDFELAVEGSEAVYREETAEEELSY